MENKHRPGRWTTVHPWVTEGRGRTRLGVGVTATAAIPEWPSVVRLARAVDELGFDSFWQADHPISMQDCWLTLGALAGVTKRIRLGPLVSCVYYRPATVLARQAADVDRISRGRAVLGLGAGWLELEFAGLGIPFPEPSERTRHLRETIEVVHGLWESRPFRSETPVRGATAVLPRLNMWSHAPFTYEGHHHRFQESFLSGGPVQEPRVPVLIGGSGEQVTFRLIARYGDMANFEDQRVKTPEEARAKLNVLRQRFDEVERPFDTLLPSYFVNLVMLGATRERVQARLDARTNPFAKGATPAELVARLRPFVEAGILYFVVNLSDFDDLETVELLATEVLPQLQPE